MKTLKRTLCLVLALALSFSVMATAASYDDYADAEAVAASKYAEAVDVVIGLGIVKGAEGNKVDLDGVFTRAMAAKIVCYLMLGEEASETLAASTTPFADVAAADWESKYVGYAADQGIIVGSQGKFNPDGELTGYALGKLLLNAMGYGITYDVIYENGKAVEVMYNYYEGNYWATRVSLDGSAIGLFEGLEGVDLDKTITRAQAMHMMANAIIINDGADLQYAVDEISTDVKDAYGRDGYYYAVKGDTEETAITGSYFESADYTYTANEGAIYAADHLAAYNKAKGLEDAEEEDKYSYVGTVNAIASGSVVEFAVDVEAKTLTEITRYTYKLDTVAGVDTTAEASGDHKGAYKIDIAAGADTYTDVVSLKKGDIIVVPYVASTAVYADAKVATPVVAKISEIAADGSVLVAGGVKYYTDANVANTTALEGAKGVTTSALNFDDTYNLYVTPAGTVAGVTVYEEAAPAYTTSIAWVLDSQAQAQGGDAESDLIGNVTTEAGKKATAVLKIVDLTGATKLLNVAVEYDEEDEKYVYAGTDNIGLGTTKNGEVGDLPQYTDSGEDGTNEDGANTRGETFVEYYLDANGNAVIVAFYDADAEVEEYAGAAYAIAGATADSKTVLNVIRYEVDEEDETKITYTAASYTGYKNFPEITAGAAYVNITDEANVIYVFAAVEVADPTDTIDTIAYCKTVGNLTAGGYAYTFVVDGKEVTYYNASNTAAEAGKFYKDLAISTDGKNVFTAQDAEEVTELVVSDVIDANYFVPEEGAIVEYAKNTTLVNLTEEAVTAIAEGQTVVVFETATDDEGVVTDMIIFVIAVAE